MTAQLITPENDPISALLKHRTADTGSADHKMKSRKRRKKT